MSWWKKILDKVWNEKTKQQLKEQVVNQLNRYLASVRPEEPAIGKEPIYTPKPDDKPATAKGECVIDVAGLRKTDPPYSGHDLEAAGDKMECGPDAPLNGHFRVLVRYVSHRNAWNIGMLARKGYKVIDQRRTVIPLDFEADGGVYKFVGFTIHERDLFRSDLAGKAGEPYTSDNKTWGVWEYYK